MCLVFKVHGHDVLDNTLNEWVENSSTALP